MNECILTISMDGAQGIPCMPMDRDTIGLNQNGISSANNSVVNIIKDKNNEVYIQRKSDIEVILERNGRKTTLENRSIRLLQNDVIYFNNHRFEIISIKEIKSQKKKKSFKTIKTMLSAAAALVVAAIPACNKIIEPQVRGKMIYHNPKDEEIDSTETPAKSGDQTTNENNPTQESDILEIEQPPKPVQVEEVPGEPAIPDPNLPNNQTSDNADEAPETEN